MGFRNPITSASAVDTGQPTGAGARVYQGSDVSGVFGILEFRDGISGDSPGQVAGRGYLTPQGNGAFTAQGGTLSLKCGTYNQTPGPELDLNVESSPTGGFRPMARISVPIIGPDAGWQPLGLNAGWSAWDTAANQPRTQLTSAGSVQLDGVVKVPAGGSFAAGFQSQVAAFPPGSAYATSSQNVFRIVPMFNAAGTAVGTGLLQVTAAGIYITNTSGAVQGAGVGWSLGASYTP